MSPTPTPPPVLDLLVIGGGPAGLATAVAALHRGARRVLVVEQSRGLRKVGRGFDMMPNQVRAMLALSPSVEAHFRPHFVPVESAASGGRAVVVDAHGTKLREIRRNQKDQLASLLWWQLQRVLLDSLPADKKFLLLNHQLVSLTNEHDCVSAVFEYDRQRENRFRNWLVLEAADEDDVSDQYAIPVKEAHTQWLSPVDSPSRPGLFQCRARVVVGADGVNSTVRRCIYDAINPSWRGLADPLYTGLYTAYLKGPHTFSDEELQQLDDEYFHDATICVVTYRQDEPAQRSQQRPFRMLSFQSRRRADGSGFVSITRAMDEHALARLSKRDLMTSAIDNAVDAGISPLLERFCRGMADLTPDEDLNIRPFFIVPVSHPPPFSFPDAAPSRPDLPDDFHRPWSHGRVVLVGDAAHGCPNFVAQGVGMAVEDALELAVRLQRAGVWETKETAASDPLPMEAIENAFAQYRENREERNCVHQCLAMNRPKDEEEAEGMRRQLWDYDPTAKTRAHAPRSL